MLALTSCRATLPTVSETASPGKHVGCAIEVCPDSQQRIDLTYLGVAGLMLRYRGNVLLTGPFFSNPGLAVVRPKASRLLRHSPPILPDTDVIAQFLPRDADHASAILIGHGHYDHLMDVPYIATHRATAAVIYGSETVRHMLMGDSALRRGSGRRVVALRVQDAGSVDHPGSWIYTADSAFRFMPLLADHAPTINVLGERYTFAAGNLSVDLDSLPRTAEEWKLGESFAFLIDVLEPGTSKTIFRIFYQDAPSAPPLGFPPLSVVAERQVDLAVLCAATSSNVPATPDSLLKVLKPRAVLVTHWESFFRSQRLPPEVSRGLHLDAFIAGLRRSLDPTVSWLVPPPHTRLHFLPTSDARK